MAGAAIARLADPLLAIGVAAAPRAPVQPEITADFAAVAEVRIERLIDQSAREHRPERLELEQELPAPRHLSRRRAQLRRTGLLLQRGKLFDHQSQSRMFALDLGQKPRRHRLSLPVPLLGEPVQVIAPARIADRHPQQPQQPLDPIAVSTLLLLQPTLFARVAPNI